MRACFDVHSRYAVLDGVRRYPYSVPVLGTWYHVPRGSYLVRSRRARFSTPRTGRVPRIHRRRGWPLQTVH